MPGELFIVMTATAFICGGLIGFVAGIEFSSEPIGPARAPAGRRALAEAARDE